MVVQLYERSGQSHIPWPSNTTDLEALESTSLAVLLTLAPTPTHVLQSLGDATLRRAPKGSRHWKRAAAQIAHSKQTPPNARISVERVLRWPKPIMLRYHGVVVAVQPCEIFLQSGHVCVTLPRAICACRRGAGTWEGIEYRFEGHNPMLPEPIPTAFCPPCTVCDRPSVDMAQCLCAAHNMLSDTRLWTT